MVLKNLHHHTGDIWMEAKEKGFYKWLGLLVLVMAQIGTSGDNSVLGVSTASLLSSLNANMSDIQLANIVYSLCAGCLMIVGGMLGLIIGWKKNFALGAFLCASGELIVATSTSITTFTWLGRLSVGLGASLMIPSVLGLIAGIYKGQDRAVAFGAIGAATGVAIMAGPIVAGLLIDTFSWRIAFGFMSAYFACVLIGSLLIQNVAKPTNKVRFDYVGTIIAVVGLFTLVIGISKVPVWGLFDPINAPFTLLGLSPALPIAILGFIVLCILISIEQNIERKYGSCLIPQSFLKTPQVRNGLYLTAMLFLCFGGAFFLIITYMQLVGKFSAIMTGIAMSSMAIPLISLSLGVPKFLPHVSPKLICRLGVLIASTSTIPMAMSLTLDGVSPLMYAGLALFGAGQGLVASQSANVIAMAVNARDAQQASGIQAATRNVGQAIGVAILGVTMLFSITGNIQNEVNINNDISTEVKQYINNQKGIVFTSNEKFKTTFKDISIEQDELDILININAEARKKSTQLSIYIMGIITFIFIFGTKSLPEGLRRKN